MSGSRIVVDIGGTQLRFARVDRQGRPGPVTRLRSADFPDLESALETCLAGPGDPADTVEALGLAVAGPVDGDRARLTNLPWHIDASALSRRLAGAPVLLVNDVAAVALLMPALPGDGCTPLRDGSAQRLTGGRLVVNLGTGFGAACWVPGPDGGTVIATEPGHMSLPSLPALSEHAAAARCVEDLLSGPGIARLRDALGTSVADPLIAEVLGCVCGDLVLATGAWGGVYLCGGALLGLAADLDRPRFLQAFEDKGAMTSRLARVDVSVLTLEDPALHGLAGALLRSD